MPQVTRRDFLKIGAAGTGAAGLTALGFDMAQAVAAKQSFHIAGVENPMYRAAGSDKWQQITWDDMLNKLAQRVKDARDASFVAQDASGNTVNRTEGIAFAGGAAFSSEEGYFATKVMRGLGLVHLEQQARV